MKNEEEYNKRKLRVLTVISEQIDPDKNKSANKNLEIFENISGIRQLAILEDETLQEIVDELGENPSEEPKISKLLEDNDPMGILEHIKSLKGNEGLDFDAMDSLEVGRFIANIRFRVMSHTDKDGNKKSTKNTENSKTPTFSEIMELKKLKPEEMPKKALELSGLDVEKLTDWEKKLVRSDIFDYAVNVQQTMMGGF